MSGPRSVEVEPDSVTPTQLGVLTRSARIGDQEAEGVRAKSLISKEESLGVQDGGPVCTPHYLFFPLQSLAKITRENR